MNKKDIRTKVLAIRKCIGKEIVCKNSKRILKKLFQLGEFRKAKKIVFYASFNNEVDTWLMIEKALKLNKEVFLPKIKNGKIIPVKVKNLNNLACGKYGILEPINGDSKKISIKYFDMIIVPGVVFDKNCNRIGFGKGYFDNFLSNIEAVKIGLGYGFQVIEHIPVTDKDVPMDRVITEKQIIRRRQS
ncbi:MAG: 5-formyltetrahydrofolate cyclo-ligase [Elusimicrobia bacterium RIFOXYC2_FULL_34_12]|nr:MAG: 5-formyltetrahydrofolate cyclo-ligase [Elusimicrobia bacterium RIFOXYC2_FULL_34_12]HAM38741.1 5-formyltetrahydrofolate cyclo-ligase [Elusimicrobiota bacterium]